MHIAVGFIRRFRRYHLGKAHIEHYVAKAFSYCTFMSVGNPPAGRGQEAKRQYLLL
jgi:hypothetical protein